MPRAVGALSSYRHRIILGCDFFLERISRLGLEVRSCCNFYYFLCCDYHGTGQVLIIHNRGDWRSVMC